MLEFVIFLVVVVVIAIAIARAFLSKRTDEKAESEKPTFERVDTDFSVAEKNAQSQMREISWRRNPPKVGDGKDN